MQKVFVHLPQVLAEIHQLWQKGRPIFDIGMAGLNCTGSKHLLEVFHKHKAEFEAAAKLDAKSLKDERPETAPPPLTTMPSAFSNFLNQPDEVKKLEQHLPIMVDIQVVQKN